ncbi:MAG: helix-turn-helix transcriptional regulator [Lachnospiraceae bacterium]|nr:helix-turn-helix transcriptional regulator [Lachnospiraceae bacterium]
MNAIEFGHFIAQQRKAVGLTQKELAERLLVTDKAVSRWENGHGYPDIETLEDLSKALEISLVELMHSKRNEADTVTIQEASESISSAISINAESRHHERCITLILFAASLLLVILIFALREIPAVPLIGTIIGTLYLWGAVIMLVDSARQHQKKYLFFALMLGFVSLAILLFLLIASVTVIN